MFEKHCRVCGIEVKKEIEIKRFGKHFCNDDHVNQFGAKIAEEERREEEYQKKYPRRDGCC